MIHTGNTLKRKDKQIFRNKMIRSKNQNTFDGLKKWTRRFKNNWVPWSLATVRAARANSEGYFL